MAAQTRASAAPSLIPAEDWPPVDFSSFKLHFFYGMCGGALSMAVMALRESQLLQSIMQDLVGMHLLKQLAFVASLAVVLLATYFLRSDSSTTAMLIDIHCFQIPSHLKRTCQAVKDGQRKRGCYTEQSMGFMSALMDRNGLGNEHAFPQALIEMTDPSRHIHLRDCIEESQMVLFDVVGNLLQKTGITAQEVDILMTSCSCFAPSPSMSAMIVNRFGMRRDVKTYSMAGLGCSSSLVCVDLARVMLKAMPNSVCMMVNHENICACVYEGNDRSMMVTNSLFRLGGGGALLSNRPCDQGRAKYELLTTERTHLGARDDAFLCMGNGLDAEGIPGVFLRKNVIEVAGKALHEHLTALAPKVLPLIELAKCALIRGYKPDFKKAFDHFLLHTGGRGVLDSLEKELELTPQQMVPCKKTLEKFGNLSAASTWYILAYIESTTGVRTGDRVWQLGFGGGFKANSAVWRPRRNILQQHACWS